MPFLKRYGSSWNARVKSASLDEWNPQLPVRTRALNLHPNTYTQGTQTRSDVAHKFCLSFHWVFVTTRERLILSHGLPTHFSLVVGTIEVRKDRPIEEESSSFISSNTRNKDWQPYTYLHLFFSTLRRNTFCRYGHHFLLWPRLIARDTFSCI